jgi:hypothetical protein
MSSECVELKGISKFTHFALVILILIYSLQAIVIAFCSGNKEFLPTSVALLSISPLIYWWLRRKLEFRIIHTARSSADNYQAVLSVARKLGWRTKVSRPSEFFQASVTGFPISWGELVTVKFLDVDVYVNSICDPHSIPSTTAFGRNSRNVQSLIQVLGS